MARQTHYYGIPDLPARDEYGQFSRHARIHCDSCQMLSINGVACHEHGCPRADKLYDVESKQWVRLVECRECGFEYFDNEESCPECR